MAKGPKVGDSAPDFELESSEGSIRLSDRLQTGAVLLVFYPGDDTPVCTSQLCDYRDHIGEFTGLGVQVIGINPQSLDSHRAFAKKHGLGFPLVADPQRNTCRAYDALGMFGMTRRSLFLIDRSGIVRYRKTDLPVFRRTADELKEIIGEISLESA